jgi:hypothetical protein
LQVHNRCLYKHTHDTVVLTISGLHATQIIMVNQTVRNASGP